MLDTCFDGKPTSDNSWLCFIYYFRKQWSSYARFGVNVSVPVYGCRFRFNEKSRDYYMQQSIPANNFKNSSLMSHAASVFTPQIFNEIQHEFEAGMTYTIKETLDVE
ncbi:hypothetical protein LIER_42643 [Lithospermum erythrorhizon]|uniref:Uncharacterized protein n=1 Tax=Lithospermum erythrorhizon TaxID=34254 RepID=A0AAV3NSR7_LITER